MADNQTKDRVIERAQNLINGDRAEQYGESSFQALADMWTIYLGTYISPAQAAEMLAILKIVRNRHEPKLDSYIDGIGYLALAAQEAFGDDADV